MNIVERINRRLPIFEQADASWKNPNLPDYDRQYAEDCLHHTIGPLTDNPRWDDHK